MGVIRRISLVVVALATMAVAVSRPASAASQVRYVPFRATISEVVKTQVNCPPAQGTVICLVYLTGTGEATDLGKVTESANPVVDFSTLDPTSSCIAEVRTSILTAANRNGDQITLRGPGHTCPSAPAVNDTWVVVGGTGRFAGATGFGTDSVAVVVDSAGIPSASVTTFTGMISSRGSNS